MKLLSSLTLFSAASNDLLHWAALDRWSDGRACRVESDLLGK
jgi:uncharacterized protein (DUF1810 family)